MLIGCLELVKLQQCVGRKRLEPSHWLTATESHNLDHIAQASLGIVGREEDAGEEQGEDDEGDDRDEMGDEEGENEEVDDMEAELAEVRALQTSIILCNAFAFIWIRRSI